MIPNYEDMPDYPWYYGCTPTAAGMIIAWWDRQPGTTDLFAGDASTWWGDGSESPAGGTRAMVAATAHVVAGRENGFTYGDWQNSTSYPNHQANPTSLADFLKTTDATTYTDYIAPGLTALAAWDVPWTAANESYQAQATTYYSEFDWTFDDFRAEIDRGYPVLLGLSGHAVAAIGYFDHRSGGDPHDYGYVSYTTWPGWGRTAWDWDGTGVPQGMAVQNGTYLQVTPRAEVTGRYAFYNNSAFDGNDPAADARDDAAIATDKRALRAGDPPATSANYTGYSRGINGIMVDIAGAADPANIRAGDFQFKVGNSSELGTWQTAPTPISVTVRPGAGSNGSDRVTIVWADHAIQNQWLQVEVLANGHTGLSAPDVFFFGNAVGESGNDPANAAVDLQDEVAARAHHTGFVLAQLTNPYDFDRDGRVNATDDLIARHNPTSGPGALQLIVAPQSLTIETPATSKPEMVLRGAPIVPSEPDPAAEQSWRGLWTWLDESDRPTTSAPTSEKERATGDQFARLWSQYWA